MITKAFAVISLFILLFSQQVYSQNEQDTVARAFKNEIHATCGFWWPQVALEYQRKLLSGKDGLFSMYAGIGGGYLLLASSSGPVAGLKLNFLLGREKHHGELSAGGILFFDRANYKYEVSFMQSLPEETPEVLRGDYLILVPSFTVGYRYHKPGGRLIFRAGFGYPIIMMYVGFGFAF